MPRGEFYTRTENAYRVYGTWEIRDSDLKPGVTRVEVTFKFYGQWMTNLVNAWNNYRGAILVNPRGSGLNGGTGWNTHTFNVRTPATAPQLCSTYTGVVTLNSSGLTNVDLHIRWAAQWWGGSWYGNNVGQVVSVKLPQAKPAPPPPPPPPPPPGIDPSPPPGIDPSPPSNPQDPPVVDRTPSIPKRMQVVDITRDGFRIVGPFVEQTHGAKVIRQEVEVIYNAYTQMFVQDFLGDQEIKLSNSGMSSCIWRMRVLTQYGWSNYTEYFNVTLDLTIPPRPQITKHKVSGSELRLEWEIAPSVASFYGWQVEYYHDVESTPFKTYRIPSRTDRHTTLRGYDDRKDVYVRIKAVATKDSSWSFFYLIRGAEGHFDGLTEENRLKGFVWIEGSWKPFKMYIYRDNRWRTVEEVRQ